MLPFRYGWNALLSICDSTGCIVNSVKNSARLTRTVFGGVSWMPRACRSSASTTMIRVNAVMTMRIAGARLSTVRTARIFSAVATSAGRAAPPSMRISSPGTVSDCAAAISGASSSTPHSAGYAARASVSPIFGGRIRVSFFASAGVGKTQRAHAIPALGEEHSLSIDLQQEQRKARRDMPDLEDVDPPLSPRGTAERCRQEALERVDPGKTDGDHHAELEGVSVPLERDGFLFRPGRVLRERESRRGGHAARQDDRQNCASNALSAERLRKSVRQSCPRLPPAFRARRPCRRAAPRRPRA